MTELASVFENQGHDQNRLLQLGNISEPRRRYIIAMTPRSGSSYLCNVLEGTRRLGVPGEYLNQELIPEIIKTIPGRTAGEYFRNVARANTTNNGVYGLKASWFQFADFIELLTGDEECLHGYRYIYLTRRNLAAQAVSLYKATASNVFHTNVHHDDSSMQRLKSLEYDFSSINQWYHHIVEQEKGWREYFLAHRISPCYVTYEEVDEDVISVAQRIAHYVGVDPANISLPDKPSVFTKVSDSRNLEWACRFMIELANNGGG